MSYESSKQAKLVTTVTGKRYCRDGQHEVAESKGKEYVVGGKRRWICDSCQARREAALKARK